MGSLSAGAHARLNAGGKSHSGYQIRRSLDKVEAFFYCAPGRAQILEGVSPLQTRQEKKRVRFKPGNWEITKSILIPKGFVVNISEGTKLNLINAAMLVSYSPLSILGTDERPVIITSSDSTGQGNLF